MSARRARSVVSIDDYNYMNENQIDIELKCAVCQQPFLSPMVGEQCGHTFCNSCITNWYRQDSSCPTCRQRTVFKPLTTRAILNQLDRLPVRCPQCNQNNIERGNFSDHIQHRCKYTIVQCDAADLKCQWTGNREEHTQHSVICPLLQIRPVVDELRTEVTALSHQLQMFMDEMRDQLNYSQKQPIPRSEANRNSHDKIDSDISERERLNQVKNNLRHTWKTIIGRCRRCNVCHDHSKEFFKCIICSRSAARANIRAHDTSGSTNDVICRICFGKYWQEIYLDR